MSKESKSEKSFIRIELTDEQKSHVTAEVGKQIDAIELTPTELEERIAPRVHML